VCVCVCVQMSTGVYACACTFFDQGIQVRDEAGVEGMCSEPAVKVRIYPFI
jgi:hypothetical protein